MNKKEAAIQYILSHKLRHYLLMVMVIVLIAINVLSVSAAVNWNNFKVFAGTTAPYASNGPGCISGPTSGSSMQPGQNCDFPFNQAYDLGAVWVDMDNDYLAWQIYAPNLTGAGFCGGPLVNPGGNNGIGITIEFDSDNNMNTGCQMGNQCFPGSEYRFYVYGDNTSKFEFFNSSTNPSCFNNCFKTNSSVNVTFNVTCSVNPSILKIAVNRSAIKNLTGMKFQTNSLKFGPVDILGGYASGGFMNNFKLGGSIDYMFEDEHPCFTYDYTNQTACLNNTMNLTGADDCVWSNFDRLCDPDFSSQTCDSFCGACTTEANCSTGSKGKCISVTAPPFLPPNANIFGSPSKMCVEDPSKFIFGGGSCDSDCNNCYSQYICTNSSYPNPIGSGSGCKWVNDAYFGDSWCDVSTFDTGSFTCSATNLNRCFTQGSCTTNNGNWSTEFNVCYDGSAPTEFICFDGNDNDGNGLVDCQDTACSYEEFCGGDIDVLTGGFGTLDTMEAMKKQMFEDMDPSPPVILFFDSDSESLPADIDINGLGVKDMGDSIGFGIGVSAMVNFSAGFPSPVSALCGGNQSGRYYYFIDNDANLSSGCNATIGTNSYSGFEYRFEYAIIKDGSSAIEVRRGFRCLTDGNFSLYPAKLSGPPAITGFGFGNKPLSCEIGAAIIAVDKSDLGNSKGNMRFMVSSSDNRTNYSSSPNANDSLLGPDNGGIYYTPGSIDFEPKDCFSNPMACGTAFSIIGGGNFMPFEDCFTSSGDEDLDGLTNCADSDCSMVPWCSGTDYTSTDKTAPSVVSNKAEEFTDFVFIHWVTNEPTNSTVSFYNNCQNSTAKFTFNELGDPSFTFDDYRPWHDLDLSNGDLDISGNAISLTSNTNYKYKIKLCDKASNCATSGCLNFTTASSQQSVQYKFDFTPPSNPLVNSTVFKIWNGSAFMDVQTNGSSTNSSSYLKNASLLFNNTAGNWSITLNGIDITKASNFNLSTAFNVTNTSGATYVGIGNSKWSDMSQNLGVDSVTIKIPGSGNTLQKCNENNVSDCSDVTAQATLISQGDGFTEWKIPTSLGFSTYGTSSTAAGNITLRSDLNTYKAYPLGVAYYNLSNTNATAGLYNITINNSRIPGVAFNVSYLNNSVWVYSSSNNVSSLFTDFNLSGMNLTLRINISIANPYGANWTINVSLYKGDTATLSPVYTFYDWAILDSVNQTYPDAGATLTAQPVSFNFTLFAGSQVNQSCGLYIDNAPYGNITAANSTITVIVPNASIVSGIYTWKIGCDAGGEIGYSATRSLTISLPPVVTLNSPVGSANLTASINFNITAAYISGTNLTCNLTIDNVINVSNYTVTSGIPNVTTIAGFAEGSHLWNVTCNSSATNSNYSVTRAFTVDTVTPVIEQNGTVLSAIVGQTINIFVNASDATTGVDKVEFILNNRTINQTNNNGTVAGATGVYNFSYTVIPADFGKTLNISMNVTDYSGNKIQTVVFPVTITELIPPQVDQNSPVSGYNTSSTSVTFNFTASDTVDSTPTCNISVDSVMNITNITTASGVSQVNITSGLNNGVHYWNVTCIDDSGNQNTTAQRNFTVDIISPTIQQNGTTASSIIVGGSVYIYANLTDTTTGIRTVELIRNNRVNQTNSTFVAVGQIALFNFTYIAIDADFGSTLNFSINVTDIVGNKNQTAVFGVAVTELIPPQVVINSPVNNSNFSTTTVTFNFTVTDNIDTTPTCNLTIDSVANLNISIISSNVSQVNSTTVSANGIHLWNITCYDDSGNQNSTETRTFTIDTVPPFFPVSGTSGGTISGTTIQVYANLSDASTGIKTADLILNGNLVNANNNFTAAGLSALYNFTYTLQESQIGATINFTINATDYVGNKNTSSVIQVAVTENVVPVVTLNSPASGQNISNTTVSFNFTVTDNKDSSLVCNITIDSSVAVANITSANGTAQVNSSTGLSQGAHLWNVTCSDDYANANTSTTRSFKVDTIAPTYSKNGTTATLVATDTALYVFATFADSGTGIKNATLWVNTNGTGFLLNQTNSTGFTSSGDTFNFTYTTYAAQYGTNVTFLIKSADYMGFSNQTVNLTITVGTDSTAPAITLVSYANNSNVTTNTASLVFSVSDNGGQPVACNLTLDGVVNVSTASQGMSTVALDSNKNVTIGGLNEGQHTWSVNCSDAGGNKANTGTFNFVVDTLTPSYTGSLPEYFRLTPTSNASTVSIIELGTGLKTSVYYSSCNSTPTVLTNNTGFYPFNKSGCTGAESLRTLYINLTDYVGWLNSTSIVYYVDAIGPNNTASFPANRTSSVNISWTTADASNVSYVGYYLDGSSAIADLGTNAANNTALSLTVGVHTIKFTANDTLNNRRNSTITYTIAVTGTINSTQFINNTKEAFPGVLLDLVLKKYNSSTGVYDNITGNLNSSDQVSFLYTINGTGTFVNITLAGVNVSDVNWNMNFTPKANDSAFFSGLLTNLTVSAPRYIVYFNSSLSVFITGGADSYYGSVLLESFNASNGTSFYIYWFFNELDASNKSRVNACTSVGYSQAYSKTDLTPCFNVTTGPRTTVYLPHFSAVAAGEDLIASTITFNAPAIEQNVTPFKVNLTLSGDASSCAYKLNVSGYTSWTSITPTGTSPKECLSGVISLPNAGASAYNLTVNVTDESGNQNITYLLFNVSDIVPPQYSNVTNRSITSSSAVIGIESNDYVNASVTYLGGSKAYQSSPFTTKIPTISLTGLSASTLINYTVKVCDNAGNCNTTAVYNFTTDASSSNGTSSSSSSSSGGGGGGGGAAANDSVAASTSHGWSSVVAGETVSMKIKNSKIAFTLLTFKAEKELKSVILEVSALKVKPNDVVKAVDKEYQYLKVDMKNFVDSDISSAIITFTVNKDWLVDNSVNEKEIQLFRYNSDKWNALDAKVIASDDVKVTYEAASPGFSVFAIGVKSSDKKEEKTPEQPTTPVEPVTQPKEVEKQKDGVVISEQVKQSNLTAIILGGIVAIAIIAGIIFAVTRKGNDNKKKKETK